MIAGQGDRRKGLKSRTLCEAKRVRDGQAEKETDRASVHAHSKAAGPLSGNSSQNSHRCICLSYLEETLGLFE